MIESTAVRGLAITGCGVASPAGLGLAALADALGEPAPVVTEPSELPFDDAVPGPVRVVPGLDVNDYLGRKGVRNLDRTTVLGLVACGLASVAAGADEIDWSEAGVVVATNTGSVRSIGEFARDTLVHERPYLVNPRAFPNTVMNCCAGQIAIWNAMHGVNATVGGGHAASLFAFRYARNALAQGHADRLVVGGVEELCAQSVWAWRKTAALAPKFPVGEGCALFVVEEREAAIRRGQSVLAELLACEVRFVVPPFGPARAADELSRCIGRALHRSGVSADEVDLVSTGATGLRGAERLEERAVDLALSGRFAHRVRVRDIVGESFSAGAALQLAALLARWRDPPGPVGRTGLVTVVGLDGNVGCLVVRVSG